MANRIELYKVQDLKEIFSLTEFTIYDLIKKGKLKGTKFGGQWYFKREDIERMFNGNEESNN